MKLASYRKGVAWIALNDDSEEMDDENIARYISTGLLADLFGKSAERVAYDILRYRIKCENVE